MATPAHSLSTALRTLPSRFYSARRPLFAFRDSQFVVVAKPLACSFGLHRASLIATNLKRFQCRTKSAMAEIATEKGKGKVQVFDSEEDLAVSLAKYTADLSHKYAKERGAFSVVLSGGSLIKSLR